MPFKKLLLHSLTVRSITKLKIIRFAVPIEHLHIHYHLWITSTVDNAHNQEEIYTLEYICFKQLDVSSNSENISV